MDSAADIVSLVLELVTWITLVPGVVLVIIGYVRRWIAGGYEKTWGVIIASPAGTTHPWFRWMDAYRELQSAPVPPHADEAREVGDEVTVYVDRRNPERARLDDPATDGRPLRVIGWILVAVGLAAAIIQLVAAFLE